MNKRQKPDFISNRKLFFITTLLLYTFSISSIFGQETQVRIGVLALRGAEETLDRWKPTAEYLTTQIPEYTFVIVPLDFEQIFEAVKNGEVDFALENPSIYVELEYLYGIDRIATLNVLCRGKATNQFGGVIFTTKNRNDINFIDELNNKKFMAVDETSFGGWIMAQREFMDFGIAPYDDFTSMQFGNTHDNVVYSVQKGVVDAGTVRTGILEKMDKEGKIDINDFKILNQQNPDNFSLLISTRLYPEWAFARVKHTSNTLARYVSIALLSMPPDSDAAKKASIAGWTIPNNYQPVHDCLKDLRVSPYEDLGKITLANLFRQYWEWILIGFLGVIFLIAVVIYISRLNKKLELTTIELKNSHDRLEQKVEERTSELRHSNRELIRESKDRKQAEEAIVASEQKYRTLFDGSFDIVLSINTEGNITSWNKRAQEIFGYAPNEIIGKNASVLVPKELLNEQKEVIALVKNNGFMEGYETVRMAKDGTQIPVEMTVSTMKDHEGNLIGLSGIMRDITQRKQAEKALEEKEHYFRSILYSIHEDIVVIDADYRITDINNTALISSGFKREDVIGKYCYEVSHGYNVPCDQMGEDCVMKEVFKTGKNNQCVHEHIKADGSKVHVDILFSPMKDADGKVTHVIEAVRDISDIMNVQDELQQSLERELSLANIVRDAPMGIAFGYPDGTLENCNAAFSELIGYSLKELQDVNWSKMLTPEKWLESEAKELKKLSITKNSVRYEKEYIRKDGKIIPIELVVTAKFDDKGNILYYIGFGNDISDRKNTEEELNKHRDHLEELVKERTKEIEAFTYSVSHDLRAPLRAISGFSEILADEYKDILDDEANRLIKVISKNALNMNQLITDLLNFSHIGRKRVKSGEINMKKIAREVFDELRQVYPKRDIKFKLGEIPSATGDRNLIRLVFTNLISNAIKFSGNEKVPKVEIGSLKKDKQQYYYIKDNGVGFDMKYVDKIFGVFQKLHSPDEFEGTGVGLAIVKKIIQNHGGKVMAEGEVDKGATFYFSLEK